MPPVEFESDEDIEELHRAEGLEDCFQALEDIPTYVIPGETGLSDIRRLMKLARLLVETEIDPDAIDNARNMLIRDLDEEYKKVRESVSFMEEVEQVSQIESRLNIEFGEDLERIPEALSTEASPENIDDLFAEVGRALGEGLHKVFWRHLVQAGNDPETAKRQTIRLLRSEDLVDRIKRTARQSVTEWIAKYGKAIRSKPEESRQEYDDILGTAKDPEHSQLEMPQTIEARKASPKWERHIYVDAKGEYGPYKPLNTWERDILAQTLEAEGAIAWFRNPPRKRYAFCVPYEAKGKYAGLYPDFLVFRRENGSVTIDILDPHDVGREDSPAKAAGLAKFVDKHPDAFGRIILAIVSGGEIKTLDLKNEATRAHVRGVTTTQHLRALCLTRYRRG